MRKITLSAKRTMSFKSESMGECVMFGQGEDKELWYIQQ